jgi:hypothetical protein
MSVSPRLRCLGRRVSVTLLLAVAACNADLQTAGVSGGGTGAVASGTVTGFGSLIVDGKVWDDSAAVTRVQYDPRLDPLVVEARLGQRVDVQYEVDGQAAAISVEPVVIGTVSQVAAGELVVLGQRVRPNLDPNLGLVTVYGGVAGPADLAAGQILEVHGAWVPDAATGRLVVQASRIEVLATLPAGLTRISGTVDGLNLLAGSFRIGDLPVTTGLATWWSGALGALANGQSLTVWSRAPLSAGPTLAADFVRVRSRSAAGRDGYLAGTVARYDRSAGTLELGGVVIDVRAATVVPPGAPLANGAYVLVRGAFASDGRFVASEIRVRRTEFGAEVSLRGTVTGFVSVGSFVVRGVAVDASTARIDLTGCPAGTTALANGLFVKIEGNARSNGVQATSVRCDAASDGATVEVTGTVGALDRAGRTFQLQPRAAPARTVTWDDATLFAAPLSAATLAEGVSVEVEAVVQGSGLRARKIARD